MLDRKQALQYARVAYGRYGATRIYGNVCCVGFMAGREFLMCGKGSTWTDAVKEARKWEVSDGR